MASTVMENYRRLRQQAKDYLAQRKEQEKIRIQIGSATCENAAGANDVRDEFRKHIEASGRDNVVLRRVGCTGRCSREPIVDVLVPGKLPTKYQNVDREAVHQIFTQHVLGGQPVADLVLDGGVEPFRQYEFLFCYGTRCGKLLDKDFRAIFKQKLDAAGVDEGRAVVSTANCFGLCRDEAVGKATHVLVRPSKVIYRVSSEQDLDEIVEQHVKNGQIVERLKVQEQPISQRFFELYGDVSFFSRQSRIALRNSGIIDPENIHEYVHYNGFEALARALDKNEPADVIERITRSKLRGRGGAGYPTGKKWADCIKSTEPVRYIICNADEGDPGAFMDRDMLEGDPFSVIEGMIIGAFAVGAHRGFLYIRAEYPMAIKRVETALALAREHGVLGDDILGSGFDFDLEIRLGAGAFVCGEETALINSIEGARGQPRIRPPYPTQSGLWGKPTVINNVETWANVPAVLHYGPDWFRQIGTDKSGGTKVFALAGKVNHTGLVEVPMGTTLREIVFDIGGGVPDGRQLKAVQTGGPAGGCIPAKWIDTPVDYDTLTAAGSIMGSGGMIVMDESDCMVDIARFYMQFSQDESCGKCTPCREGTKRMLEILERITAGKGELADLDNLERLGRLMRRSSLCGLGRAAANPVLSTLTHFRDEYMAHVVEKRCPAHRCTALTHYEISAEKCVGCTACARACPVQCIIGKPRETHIIEQARCIHCGRCFQVCRFAAVDRT
ncbi:MAG: 4Fe-4S binding protein [Phycisphaerae bacterium]|nr:4Fe-4S binding protein [Phycisphaerae bacterium]